jgi:hypothetical protein
MPRGLSIEMASPDVERHDEPDRIFTLVETLGPGGDTGTLAGLTTVAAIDNHRALLVKDDRGLQSIRFDIRRQGIEF